MKDPDKRLRVALIGCGGRTANLYVPLIQGLADDLEIVSVWSRSEESARRLGERLSVPWFTDVAKLVADTAPDVGIVSVSYHANGDVGLMAVKAGLNVLVETPIAHDLAQADAIIATARERGVKVEVAEQFHRRPLEQVKLALIASGLMGRVYASFNDFAGHGYHGASVMRSYLGFDAKPVRVTGFVGRYDLAPHWALLSDTTGPRTETQEHGIIEFDRGRVGVFHWTDVAYDCPMRWWRSSRFLAEKGMGITIGVGLEVQERLSTIAPGGEAPRFITIERRFERCDGGALRAMIAHTGDPDTPIVRWDNPLYETQRRRGLQWHDDEIGVAGCIMSLVDAVRSGGKPTYGAEQGRLDQEIILAIRHSAERGGGLQAFPLERV